ncbi:MAG: cell division protein FtsQ/DivIB [Woeseiaceae bacterium]|nr:cell division protein FtsQ/DivIB [Woeseiaceae bacterium]
MARKQAKTRKQAPRVSVRLPRIPVARIGGVVLAMIVIVLGHRYGGTLVDRPIEKITIEGPFQRVSALQIEAAIGDELANGLLSADLGRIQARLVALPWVDRAIVARRWPQTLEVSYTEQVPAASWGDGGLLNTRGELFVTDARHVPAELPRLSGPEGRYADVAERYLAIREQLIPRGLDVRSLTLDARGAWDMTLQNGIAIRLGKRDIEARTALLLDVVVDLVMRRAAEIEFVDMRYSNGFTVGWNGAAPPGSNDEPEPEQEMLAERSR